MQRMCQSEANNTVLGSNFKSHFSFNNWSILEIHDYFRTMGNVCFNNFNLPQQINTLSNQDFTGFGNFNNLENLFCM